MPNKNYVKGRRKEYAIRRQLLNEGCVLAQRMAGSHSEVDVIGINTETKTIKLVQAKPDSMSETLKKQILERNKALNGEFKVEFSVV